MVNASSNTKLLATMILIGAVGLSLWFYFGRDGAANGDSRGSVSVGSDVAEPSNASDLVAKESPDVSQQTGRDTSNIEASKPKSRSTHPESASLHEEVLKVDSLPQERRWLSTNGSVAMKDLKSALESDDFDSMIQRLKDEALDNEHATELMNVYSDHLRSEVHRMGGDQFRLDQMACGVRTCVGQVLRAAGSEANWVNLGQLGLSQDGPPIYLSLDSRVPYEAAGPGFDPTAYRFFISIDPDNRSFDLSSGP